MKDKYLDEIILEERRKRMEAVLDLEVNLEEDLPEEYLQTIDIEDGKITIKIPAFMEDMPQEWIENKYEFEPSPQIIKTNKSGTVNFTFSLLDVTVPGEELPIQFRECREGMRKFMPELVFFDEGEEEINGIRVCWTEFMNNARGGKIYNLLFFAATERVLVGSLNCPYQKHELWIKIGKLCMKTLRGRGHG